MNPEKYRTNKSSLAKFLEKKEVQPINKNHLVPNSFYFSKLQLLAAKAYEIGDEETLARLEAVGCLSNLGILLQINFKMSNLTGNAKQAFDEFINLQENDKYDNMWRGQLYNPWGAGVKLKSDERYTVAGKTYASKTEFLLSRTALGRALL
jgi:hypothetical protein